MVKFRYRALSLVVLSLISASAVANRPVQIISEGKGNNYWLPAAALLVPGIPPDVSANIGDVCVSIGYYLGNDGIPSDFAYLKSWSDPNYRANKGKKGLGRFAQTAVAALQTWRFVPAQASKPRPMYTSATFIFAAGPTSDEAALRVRCAIPDLKDFVAKARLEADPMSRNEIGWQLEWFKAKTRAHGLNRE